MQFHGNTSLPMARTLVLQNVWHAMKAMGQVFAMSYNIIENGNDVLARLKNDWVYRLVDKKGIISNSQYIYVRTDCQYC